MVSSWPSFFYIQVRDSRLCNNSVRSHITVPLCNNINYFFASKVDKTVIAFNFEL